MEILLIILIIFNWLIYHKFVNVIYIGSMRKSITNEFIWSAIFACFEIALIYMLGQIILIIIIVIALCVGFILAIKEIYKFAKKIKLYYSKNKTKKVKSCNEQNYMAQNKCEIVSKCKEKNNNEVVELKDTEDANKIIKNDNIFCTFCGKNIVRSSKYCTFCGSKNNYQ